VSKQTTKAAVTERRTDVTLAEALSAERERQDISVNELAKRAGVPYSRAHGVLSGATPNPGILTVRKILNAMGKSLAWLEKQMEKRTDR
jgi:transcriptional regulator with XRE-family HTH domain